MHEGNITVCSRTLESSSKDTDNKDLPSVQNPQSVLLQMAQLPQDEQYFDLRKQVLSLLAAKGKTGNAQVDAKTIAVLQAALTDRDAEIRAQAVFGLSRQDSTDKDHILYEALRDKSADVRLAAVSSADRDDPQSQVMLHEALADSDETVRAAAGYKLGLKVTDTE